MTPEDLVLLADVRERCVDGRARATRLACDVSLSEIATTVDTTPASVSRWEHGKRSPRGEAGLRYARLLQLLEARGGQLVKESA